LQKKGKFFFLFGKKESSPPSQEAPSVGSLLGLWFGFSPSLAMYFPRSSFSSCLRARIFSLIKAYSSIGAFSEKKRVSDQFFSPDSHDCCSKRPPPDRFFSLRESGKLPQGQKSPLLQRLLISGKIAFPFQAFRAVLPRPFRIF